MCNHRSRHKEKRHFMWLRLRNVEGKKKKDSCPFLLLENSGPLSPPQESQTPFSSLGTLDFLSTYLGIDSLIRTGHLWGQGDHYSAYCFYEIRQGLIVKVFLLFFKLISSRSLVISTLQSTMESSQFLTWPKSNFDSWMVYFSFLINFHLASRTLHSHEFPLFHGLLLLNFPCYIPIILNKQY